MTLCSSIGSLILDGSKFAGAAIISNDPAIISFLPNQASIDELVHQAGSCIAILGLSFHLLEPLLHGIELGELRLGIGLFLRYSLLIRLDLSHSSSSLRGNFEHVCRDTFAHYNDKKESVY